MHLQTHVCSLPYPMQDINNEIIRRHAATHPNVGIIDWHGATEGHPELLVDDGTHPTPDGRAVLANLYLSAMAPVQ